MILWFRDIDRLFDAFWWSFFDVVIWGLMTTHYVAEMNPGATGQIMIGIIFWTALARSQWEISVTMVVESWDRNLINIFSSPLTLFEFLFSSVVLGFAKMLIVLIFTSIVTLLFISFNVFSLNLWIIPLLANIFLTSIWLAFFINSLILRYGKNVITFAWTLIFLVNPISGVMYPLSVLPVWLQTISKAIPTSYVFEGMRSILISGNMDPKGLVYSFGLNLLYIFFSVMFFTYTFKKARVHGWLIKLA
ncbi:ABC transporter permease [Patescibacteria group bacterium]